VTVTRGGGELLPALAPLWEALFDHHLSIGAAGIATIPRERSWPLRRAHYERLLAEHRRVAVWLASDAAGPGGYALSYESDEPGPGGGGGRGTAAILETLSVLPRARGARLGSRLMDLADAEARAWGADLAVVNVMGGNERARELYLRRGYAPRSETWMRARPAGEPAGPPAPAGPAADPFALAAAAGFDLELTPGPDDTWSTPDRIAGLTPSDGAAGRPDRAAFTRLCETLERAGLWAVQVTVAAPPAAAAAREMLREAGFRVSTERLARRLPPAD